MRALDKLVGFTPDCLVFDFDGTIADSRRHRLRSWQETLDRFGLDYSSTDLYRAVNQGMDNLDIVAAACRTKLVGISPNDLSRAKDEWRREHLGEVALFPEVPQVVRALRENSIRLAVCSRNIEAVVRAVLAREGIEQDFEYVVARLDWSDHTRHEILLQRALSELEVKADRCLFVADTIMDQKTARSLGVPFVAAVREKGEIDLFMTPRITSLLQLID